MKKNYKKFIERLKSLSSGDLAILRRCNRNPLEDERILAVLYKLGAEINYNNALISCLYAVYHNSDKDPFFEENYNFGKFFKEAYDPENKKNDTRFRAILSSDKGDSLAYRLRQAVRLMKGKNKPIDFSKLLEDLSNWDNQKRFVQIKWTEGYYNYIINKNTNPISKNSIPNDIDTEDFYD